MDCAHLCFHHAVVSPPTGSPVRFSIQAGFGGLNGTLLQRFGPHRKMDGVTGSFPSIYGGQRTMPLRTPASLFHASSSSEGIASAGIPFASLFERLLDTSLSEGSVEPSGAEVRPTGSAGSLQSVLPLPPLRRTPVRAAVEGALPDKLLAKSVLSLPATQTH